MQEVAAEPYNSNSGRPHFTELSKAVRTMLKDSKPQWPKTRYEWLQ